MIVETAPSPGPRSLLLDPDETARFLRSFQDPDSEGAAYLADHFKRFLETLRAVPPAGPGDSLLELGAAFHHLTPGLARFGGYTRITCNDLWAGERRTVRKVRSKDGAFTLDVPVDNFDVEKDPYPYEDGVFDGVVCCEILEHLSCDPMYMLREINRVLKTGGWLLLTTPNVASLKGAASLLQGGSPYVWGHYPVGGRPSDRHNREYAALELKKVLELAGFSVARLTTVFSWSEDDPELTARLAAFGFPTDLRGDNTIVLARRAGPPQSRYPVEIYQAGAFGHDNQGDQGEQALRTAGNVQERPSAVPSEQDAPAAPLVTRPLRVVVVNNIVPNHDRGGSCARMWALLEAMLEQGHTLHYVARDARGMDRYVRDLERIGVEVHATDPARLSVWEDLEAPALDLAGILEGGSFDVAILLLWFWSSPTIPEQYLEEIRRLSPRTRIIVLTDDVHWLHDARLAALTGRRSDLERALGFRDREREIYARADLVATITEEDASRIRAEELKVPVDLIPHHLSERRDAMHGFEARRDILIAGAFAYHANVDGAMWFLRDVWPSVHAQLPGVRLKIVGSDPPQSLESLAQDGEAIDVIGWVPDLDAEMERYRIFISPIRYGTGLKTKNIQAMRAGIPVVGTTISLEGSGARQGREAVIEDDPARFAERVVTIYTDEPAWARQAHAARALFRARFTRPFAGNRIEETLARALFLPPDGARADLESSQGSADRADSPPWSIFSADENEPRVLQAATAVERFRARLDAHQALAVTLLGAGRPTEAISEMRKLLSHAPCGAVDANPRFFAGIMCRFGDAYRALAAQASLHNDQETVLLDPRQAARACYLEALLLDPDEDEAREGLLALDGGSEARPARENPSTTGAPGASENAFPYGPRPVPIEKRGHAFLASALEGDLWKTLVHAYLERFTAKDDVSLLLLGSADRLEPDLLAWVRAQGLDEEGIADIVIVPAPRDPREIPRFVAAADAILAAGAGERDLLSTEAKRQRIPVLVAGRDNLGDVLP